MCLCLQSPSEPVRALTLLQYLSVPSHSFSTCSCPHTPSVPVRAFTLLQCLFVPSHPFSNCSCPHTPSVPVRAFTLLQYLFVPSNSFSTCPCPHTPSLKDLRCYSIYCILTVFNGQLYSHLQSAVMIIPFQYLACFSKPPPPTLRISHHDTKPRPSERILFDLFLSVYGR